MERDYVDNYELLQFVSGPLDASLRWCIHWSVRRPHAYRMSCSSLGRVSLMIGERSR